MRLQVPAAVLVLTAATTLSARGDDCADLAAHLVASPATEHGPYVARADGKVGDMASVTVQHVVSDLHMLVETEQPAGVPPMLHHDGNGYLPQGDGWLRVTEGDAATMQAQARQSRADQAARITAATCTTEQVEGQDLTRIDIAIGPDPVFADGIRTTYWVTPGEARRVRMDMAYVLNGMTMSTRFDFTPAPGLTLPTP